MQRSRIFLLATALTVLGAGAACGGGGGGGGGDKAGDSAAPAQKVSEVKSDGAASNAAGGSTVTITAKEFGFDQKEIKVAAGQATTIVLKNGGAIEHDFTIENPAFNVKAVATKSEQKQITFPSAGSYTFYCSIPGHRQAGMEGTVSVS